MNPAPKRNVSSRLEEDNQCSRNKGTAISCGLNLKVNHTWDEKLAVSDWGGVLSNLLLPVDGLATGYFHLETISNGLVGLDNGQLPFFFKMSN